MLDLRPLILVNAVCMTAMMAFVAVIGPIVRELGLAEWQAGVVLTIGGVLWMVLARRWGRASDRLGRKRILMVGIAGFALSYLALALFVDRALLSVPAMGLSLLALTLGRAAMGAFFAAIPTTLAALVADHAPGPQRAAQMAKLGAANAVGLVVGPAAAGALAAHGLSLPMYLAALMPWLALAVMGRLRLPPTAPRQARGGPPQPLRLLDPRLRLPMFASFAAMFCVSIAQVTVGFFALDRLGLSAGEGARAAGYALTAVGVSLMLSQSLVVRMNRVQPHRWMLIGCLIGAVGFGSTALSHSLAGLMAAYFVAAFGMGFVYPSFQALAANAVQAHEQGAAAGSISAAQGLGVVVGPLVGTVLYGAGTSLPYLLIAVVLGGLATVVGVSARRLSR